MSFDFWLGLEVAGEPTPEHAQKLIANFDSQCQQAASALHKADVLVLFTGAGFSADSGLAVYADVARVPAYQERGLDYCDICQPFWLESDPDLFYGFWGQCFSDYRTTRPHEGYNIIARWRDDKNEAKGASVAEDIRRRVLRKMELRRPFEQDDVTLNKAYEVTGGPAGAFYSFTSNVDAHFFDVFEAHEIHECHGNIETWQCSSPYCFSGVWRVPIDHYFVVDQETMLAPPNKCLKKENKEDTPKKSATEDNNIKTDKNDAAKQSTDDEKRIGDGVAHIGRTKGNKERSNILKNMPPPLVNPGPHADKAWERTSNWPKCGHCLSPAR